MLAAGGDHLQSVPHQPRRVQLLQATARSVADDRLDLLVIERADHRGERIGKPAGGALAVLSGRQEADDGGGCGEASDLA